MLDDILRAKGSPVKPLDPNPAEAPAGPREFGMHLKSNSSQQNLQKLAASEVPQYKKFSEQILDEEELRMPEIVTQKQKNDVGGQAQSGAKKVARTRSPRNAQVTLQPASQQNSMTQLGQTSQPNSMTQIGQTSQQNSMTQIGQTSQQNSMMQLGQTSQQNSQQQIGSPQLQQLGSSSPKVAAQKPLQHSVPLIPRVSPEPQKPTLYMKTSQTLSDSGSNLAAHSTKGSDNFRPEAQSPRKDSYSSRQIDPQTMSNFINMKIKNYKGNRSKDEAIIFNSPEERLAYFNKTYEIAEKAFRSGRFYEAITQLAKASEFIHPDFFRRDIKTFQEGITHLIKGFMILAQAHFEIKDYESCIMFADIILQDKESYEALKLKYKSLQKLNKLDESQEILNEIIETYGKSDFCDLEFKELYNEQVRQKKFSENENEENKPVKLLPLLNFFRRQLEMSKTQIALSGISSLFLTLLIRNLLVKYFKNSKHNNRISVCFGICLSILLFWLNKTIQNESQQKRKKNSYR